MAKTTSNLDLSLRMESDPAQIALVRQAIEQHASAAGFDKKSCDEIGLCVNEALANVIKHAYENRAGEPIELTVEIAADDLGISIRDWGKGVNPAELPPSPASRDPLLPGGLGMICIKQMMDSVVFTRQPDGMLLTLRRRKNRGKA